MDHHRDINGTPGGPSTDLALAPGGLRARLAAPRLRRVDDVVVNETGRMDHLRDHRHVALTPQQLDAETQRQGRPGCLG